MLRISLPMGVSFNGHAGAIDWIQSRFKKGRPATLYFDEVRTPAYTDCLNRLYERVLASDLAGLYHAGGPRALSLYEIAQVDQSRRRLRSRFADGLPSGSKPGRFRRGPATSRWIPRRWPKRSAKNRSIPGRTTPPFVPTHRDWHHERERVHRLARAAGPRALSQSAANSINC